MTITYESVASFTVNTPQQNDFFDVGEDVTITWDTYGSVANVKIEFTSDNGQAFSTIVSSTSNTGTYNWTTPDIGSDKCFIKISDASDPSKFNNSGLFSVWDISNVDGIVSGITPAEVYYSGPSSSSITTDAQGSYLFKLYPGDYKIYALADIYSSDTIDLTVPPDISGIDLEILFPQISTDPEVINVKILPDMIEEVELVINNKGTRRMDFSAISVNASRSNIIINELYVSVGNFYDGFELWNRGKDVLMAGWKLQWNDNQQTSGSYTFPNNFVFKEGETIVIMENESQANGSYFIYSGGDLNWEYGTTELSISLLNEGGKGVDFVRSAGNNDNSPAGTGWEGTGIPLSGNYVYRTRNEDNNDASDWISSVGGGTPLSLNSGQYNSVVPVSWLQISPENGVVNNASNNTLTLTIDDSGLSLGTYLDTILIYHNAKNEESPLRVACNMEVTSVGITVQNKMPSSYDLIFYNSMVLFQVPKNVEKNRINVSLYNISGKLVKTLINDNFNTGYYSVPLNTLANGLYVCRMEAGKFNKAINIVMTK